MPSNTRSSRIATTLAVLLVVSVVALAAAAAWVARSQAIAEWGNHLDNLSLVLAEQASQEVSSAYLVLDSIAESVQANEVASAAQLRAKMGTLEHFHSMRDKTRGLPQVDVATIVADNGDVINFTRAHPAPPINLADRDYFREQFNNPKLGTFISKPVRNKGNGQWTFYLSRRLNGPHGEFIGLALVGFSSTFLSEFYKKINLGGGATVTLYRRDFTLLARWPHIDALMGQVNRSGTSYTVIEQMKRTHAVLQTASPRLSAGGSAVARLGAARLIDKYPLIINVTVTDDVYLAQWRRFSLTLALIAALSVLAIGAASLVLIRSLQRRERVMEEMRHLKTVAEAANRAKSEFLAMMSHEIRTPLTAIMGFAELMAGPHGASVSADAVPVILRNGQHLLGIINDILDISKIEAGRLQIESLAYSPIEVMAAVQSMMGAQAASKGIGFAVTVAYPFPARVMGDPTRWKQVLFNLCSNAIKFTELGSVRLALSYDAARARLVCRVTDTGIGISPAQRGMLFQPFTQADNTVARKYGGTGLGLHLVSQLVAQMGGAVTVESEVGQGSQFDVEVAAALPAGVDWLRAAPQPAPAPGRADPFALRLRGRILLAEDGPDNRMLVSAFLQGIGLACETAGDGARAVELALAGDFDLVLMDMQMPVMDGARATAVLRAAGFAQPIVALTANVMPDDVGRYLRAGCTECVAKPINFTELGNTLAALLGQRAAPAPSDPFAQLDGYGAIRQAFEDSLGARLDELARHLADAAWAEAAALAHLLKGSAGSFGYPGVTIAAGELEQGAAGADAPAARAAFARLLALDELRHLRLTETLHEHR